MLLLLFLLLLLLFVVVVVVVVYCSKGKVYTGIYNCKKPCKANERSSYEQSDMQ